MIYTGDILRCQCTERRRMYTDDDTSVGSVCPFESFGENRSHEVRPPCATRIVPSHELTAAAKAYDSDGRLDSEVSEGQSRRDPDWMELRLCGEYVEERSYEPGRMATGLCTTAAKRGEP
jgi:hypothetical protein